MAIAGTANARARAAFARPRSELTLLVSSEDIYEHTLLNARHAQDCNDTLSIPGIPAKIFIRENLDGQARKKEWYQ